MRRQLLVIALVLNLIGVTTALVHPASGQVDGTAPVTISKVQEARFEGNRGEPFFALLVGNDGRPGLDGQRGDALHVLAVNPSTSSATILNIPRDTWVDVPGHGGEKITMAYWYGGPQLQAETVRGFTGIPISFVITTSFDGFTRMVDEMGGMDFDVPFPMNDFNSGARFEAGPQRLDGAAALAFARNRNIPDGDLRRTEHQGRLLISALSKVQNEAATPSATLRCLGILARNTHLEGVGLTDLYRLARLAMSIDPTQVRNVTLPAREGKVGPQYVVFANPSAGPLLADLRDDGVLQAH
jgi:polyisoprenyl-teichoic acid--peptidoglycan teichoic acid transferase